MGINNVLNLLCGLGLFLFGMKYMGAGLEAVAGPKLNNVLEKLTRNPIMGFLLGVFVTACLQSSSAVTVMTMGLVSAGMMDLMQATSVIIGSNIGTTITSVLIAADISFIAPVCIFVGALFLLFSKNKIRRHIGDIILGFGVLFLGLSTMSGAMKVLKDVAWFTDFINKTAATGSVISLLFGFILGIVICAVMQSSSAAVGVTQMLALQGLMPIQFASFFICGINVGSAVPVLVAGLGAKNSAKRASFIYLMHNVVGAIIFVPISFIPAYTQWIDALNITGAFKVALLHIIFKVVTAIILLPFSKQLVALSYKVIPKRTNEGEVRLKYIDMKLVNSPSVALKQIQQEVRRMADAVKENFVEAFNDLMISKPENADKIKETEDLVDFLNSSITNFMIAVNRQEMPEDISKYIGRVFHVVNDLERIGDHAIVLLEKAEELNNKNINFSESARKEIYELYEKNIMLYDIAVDVFLKKKVTESELIRMHDLEKDIDALVMKYHDSHIDRLRAGECTTDTGIVFVESLHDMERVCGHSTNIGWAATEEGEEKEGI